ncbi:MAG TPA: SoxR reducing system RseC family protein [Clostridiales bacterium]|nr:SoxR reducing system RseC family protein [Clostridiales bacterium]
MTQNARVVKILDKDIAEVTVERTSACGNCASCGAACAFRRSLVIKARNRISAGVGDSVIISTRSSKIILAAFVVYIVPFILLFAAYTATSSAGLSEKASILISAAALIIGFVIARVYNSHVRTVRGIEFEIIAINK